MTDVSAGEVSFSYQASTLLISPRVEDVVPAALNLATEMVEADLRVRS